MILEEARTNNLIYHTINWLVYMAVYAKERELQASGWFTIADFESQKLKITKNRTLFLGQYFAEFFEFLKKRRLVKQPENLV